MQDPRQRGGAAGRGTGRCADCDAAVVGAAAGRGPALAVAGALVLAACATTSPPADTARIEDRIVAAPASTLEACLRARLAAPEAAVAGIAPVTTLTRGGGRVRIEQWFVTPATHQRTVFELAPAGGDGTRVTVQLLQQDAQQYRAGGYARAARAALADCAPATAAPRP